ncbi:MAG: toxin-antitoxin system HicB family antitoxin [Caldilineaceae bacterium]|nr:toxin-antitoxin system HicB family antitoxin [Caldilineaceae bacterium]MCB0126419.1 toxin-antitoxin system HicB family antitoxin [Caldilineaceae bacterium]
MTTLSLRLPESLHRGVKELAKQDGISINQFIAVAVAEKISALATEEYIRRRAERASRAKFDAALAQIPHAEPDEQDRITE